MAKTTLGYKKSVDSFIRSLLSTKVLAFIVATGLLIKGYITGELWIACYGLFFGTNYLQKRLYNNKHQPSIDAEE